ncbi:MAG: dihydrolipoamide dehydrogenase [Flavobacteriaceae bacterium]|nr:dihydrolipoamide dehydrogenase [Flavobacteriaceae bacterium]
MRAIIFTLLLFTVNLSFSQINTPRVSPASEVEQMVGLTEIEIEYSRPSMRGREVFGNLVPFGKVWRTGADNSTKISFDTDVIISGKTIQSGTYSIFSIPNKESWEIIFYSDVELWGVPRDWSENKIVFSSMFDVKKLKKSNTVETFTISFNDLTNNDVNISISWENTSVDIKIEVPTRSMVESDINKVLSDNPKSSDYYAAAVFYRQENINLDKALEWMNKAIEMNESPRFWQYRQQSLIMAANDKFADAVDAAKKSLNLAIEADNQDYIKMNRESIAEWSKKL